MHPYYPYRIKKKFFRRYRLWGIVLCALVLAAATVLTVYSVAPTNYPRGKIVRIEKDMTVSTTASMLKEKGFVRSAYLYKLYVVLLHPGKGVQAGSYLFDQPESSLRLAYRTAYGVSELQKVKVTIFEGSNSKEIAAIIKRSIPAFDAASFIVEAHRWEGYLFPETYFFNPNVTPAEVIAEMRSQFSKAIVAVTEEMASSSRSLSETIIMASIVEEEANNTVDREVISGILWKRIKESMPLQVDAPFYYLFGKGSSQLTRDDLAIASPYNTYIHKGLPVAPISNPGLDAIRAVLNPKVSPYYFYLADRLGITHYAETHDGHVTNKVKYLY